MKRYQLRAAALSVWLAVGLAVSHGPASAQDDAAAKAAFHAAEAALNHHFNGVFLDDDPRAPGLLKAVWRLVKQWAVDYLNRHPAATATELKAAIGTLSPDLNTEAMRLDARTVLVSVSLTSLGTVFIIADRGHRFGIAWDITDTAARPPRGFGMLATWLADRARPTCRESPRVSVQESCGSISGTIGKLPDQRDGHHRFYLDATYGQPMGSTVAAQISIWKLTNRTARPLFVKAYNYMIDQSRGTRVVGDVLHLAMKTRFKTFFVCGPCEGRQLDWRIRIGPDRIENLGEKSLTPEVDLVDTLFDRMLKRKMTKDIATKAVTAVLKPHIDKVRKEAGSSGLGDALGYFWGSAVTVRNGRKKVCVSTDNGGTFLFTIDSGGSKLRLSTAQYRGGETCGG